MAIRIHTDFIVILNNGTQAARRKNQTLSTRQIFCVYRADRHFSGDYYPDGVQYALGQVHAAQKKRGLRPCAD